jgi:hypothetical protein
MGEIEEIIGIEGLPALEKKDTDNCCEHAPVEGYECDWIVDRIILPELGAQGGDEEYEGEGGGEASRDRSQRRLTETYDEINAQGGGTPQEVIAGQAGNLTTLALEIGYPILKPFLEEQVRRAKVSVRWKEGPSERGFDVIQFLVSEQIAASDPNAVEDEE